MTQYRPTPGTALMDREGKQGWGPGNATAVKNGPGSSALRLGVGPRKGIARRGLLLLGFLLFRLAGGMSENIPGFGHTWLTWYASDIVIADEGVEIDGVLTVTSVWKGDLQPGDVISVPDLLAFAAPEKRTIHDRFWVKKPRSRFQALYERLIPEEPPEVVTGRGTVLFLKRGPAVGVSSPEGALIGWKPAAGDLGFVVSVAWIEAGAVYANLQIVNPGPRLLVRYLGWGRPGLSGRPDLFTAAELSRSVHSIISSQEALKDIAGCQDPRERARRAAEFASAEELIVVEHALDLVGDCGPPALAFLAPMLEDTSPRAPPAFYVVRAMYTAAGDDAGLIFPGILGKHLADWKTLSGDRSDGVGGSSSSDTPLSAERPMQFIVISRMMTELERYPLPDTIPAVRRVREFVDSLSAGRDDPALESLKRDCDRVLERLQKDAADRIGAAEIEEG